MQTRKLRRSRSDRRIAGVCAGLATYFGTDPTLVRLVFVLLGLPGGVPGTVLYLILWLVMPESYPPAACEHAAGGYDSRSPIRAALRS